ncbi:MAG: enoyl-CoA hydratase/isomerase family protein [Reyranellaceae bacterium]
MSDTTLPAFEHIEFAIDDGVATLTLNRPEARNALSMPMRRDLDAALAILKARAGDEVKALILTGAGGAFCAGGDVKAMHQRSGAGDAFAARERLREAHNRLLDLMNLEMPVIVAVDGAAAGAGFSLSLVGDFILASSRAFFAQSFVRIGLVPDWNGLFLLPRLVGLQKAKELMFTGRRIGATEAQELGLVHAVYPPEELMDAARDMARRFRDAPTRTIGLTKNILNQSLHLDPRAVLELEAFAQATARSSDYHKAAVRRFVEKQPALFDWDAADRRAAKGKSR